MYRALIVDDDPLICDLVEHFCTKDNRISYCVYTHQCQDALRLLAAEDFDLVFLDYNLPDMPGRTFLEMSSTDLSVIMITSNADFAVDSYQYDQVVDFLIKPLSFERFQKSLDRLNKGVREHSSSLSEHIFVKEGHNMVKVTLPEVLYVKSESNYVAFVMSDRKVLTLASLKNIEEKLKPHFRRTHRSYLVNVSKIDEVHPEELKLGHHTIPLSPTYKSSVLSGIDEW